MVPTKIFLQVDLSNAENRVLFALSGDSALQALACERGRDLHTEGAQALFRKRDISKDERQLGKIISHGVQRGMRGRRLSENLLKHLNVVIDEAECERYVDRYLETYPGIERYFDAVRKDVIRYRALSNSWGRIVTWAYDALDETLYREALSWLPQSEIGDLMNRWGFLALYRRIEGGAFPGTAINIPVHDSLLVSCPPAQVWPVAAFLRDSLERPRSYRGCSLSIPLEFAIGRTWAMTTSWRVLPERDEMERATRELVDAV
jgi:DNA polymerase-1